MRTWDENRSVINDFWPTEWNPEETKLMHDDLSPLDQATLYDAIRNTKRKHDTPFVHLKWLLDEYRELASAKKHALKSSKPKDEKLQLNIDDDHDRKLCDQFVAYIDECEPQHFTEVESRVLDKLPSMHSASAVRVLSYARARLLGQETKFSRVTKDGGLQAVQYTKKGWR
jgi:hypothetical protein